MCYHWEERTLANLADVCYPIAELTFRQFPFDPQKTEEDENLPVFLIVEYP